jgi:hypothetical protein
MKGLCKLLHITIVMNKFCATSTLNATVILRHNVVFFYGRKVHRSSGL